MEASGVSLVSRRHLEKILSEQGFAYNIVVNERARLGRLAGADILLVSTLQNKRSNYIRAHEPSMHSHYTHSRRGGRA